MLAAREAETHPTRARMILAGVVVLLTVGAVWKFIDYRTQPPPPPAAATGGEGAKIDDR